MEEGVIGFITLFAGGFAPRYWALCDGRLVTISSNTALFAIIGTTYGGDGRTNFKLPDLCGRAIIGAGSGISHYEPGDVGGIESTSPLKVKNIPAHTHSVQVTITPHAAGTANSQTPADAVFATNPNQQMYEFGHNTNMASYTAKITPAVVGRANPEPLAVLHPVLALNYIICLEGVFPGRD